MRTARLSTAGASWRLGVATACLGAAAWGLYLLSMYHDTVYWNLGAGSHVYAYLHPALYAVTLLAGLLGVYEGLRSWRSPGTASGSAASIGLALLVALSLWACAATLLARAYAV